MVQKLTVREPRKDAQRNRTQILDAAREAFASEGVEISMDAIAKRAGVGAGTLYRHFPSKDALLAALLNLHHAALDEQRAAVELERDTGRALQRWIDALGEWMLAYHGLPEPLRTACQVESALTPTCLHVISTTEAILQSAQRDGLARQTLQGRDIFLGALAIAWASGVTAADERTRAVLRDLLKDGWAAPRPEAD